MESGSWSRDPQDLSQEPLLGDAPSVTFAGGERPRIGRWVVLSKLGQGGMGAVYHAVDAEQGTEVALKLRLRNTPRPAEELIARYEREARLATQLESPHLVRVVEVGEDAASRTHYVVLEYVNGITASDWRHCHGGRAPEDEALDVCIGAARGLAVVHVRGIVHRDVKPANILIPFGADGRARPERAMLGDLDLARHEDGAGEITRTNFFVGTPGYMACEQAEDPQRAGKPADVLSVGATLFKLLTDRPPFVDPESEQWLRWTVLGKYVHPRELRPDLAPATVELIETCLRSDPTERFPDASALVAALELCRSSLAKDDEARSIDVVEDVRRLVASPEEGATTMDVVDLVADARAIREGAS